MYYGVIGRFADAKEELGLVIKADSEEMAIRNYKRDMLNELEKEDPLRFNRLLKDHTNLFENVRIFKTVDLKEKPTMTVKFAFISRHTPTAEQIALAAEKHIELVHIGDRDAFTIDPKDIDLEFAGVVVVHPAAAMRLKDCYTIGIFENGSRPGIGERPEFFAKALHLFE